jgi:hypothetical protein
MNKDEGYLYPCYGWHEWDCNNTECSEHPDTKLKEELND